MRMYNANSSLCCWLIGQLSCTKSSWCPPRAQCLPSEHASDPASLTTLLWMHDKYGNEGMHRDASRKQKACMCSIPSKKLCLECIAAVEQICSQLHYLCNVGAVINMNWQCHCTVSVADLMCHSPELACTCTGNADTSWAATRAGVGAAATAAGSPVSYTPLYSKALGVPGSMPVASRLP